MDIPFIEGWVVKKPPTGNATRALAWRWLSICRRGDGALGVRIGHARPTVGADSSKLVLGFCPAAELFASPPSATAELLSAGASGTPLDTSASPPRESPPSVQWLALARHSAGDPPSPTTPILVGGTSESLAWLARQFATAGLDVAAPDGTPLGNSIAEGPASARSLPTPGPDGGAGDEGVRVNGADLVRELAAALAPAGEPGSATPPDESAASADCTASGTSAPGAGGGLVASAVRQRDPAWRVAALEDELTESRAEVAAAAAATRVAAAAQAATEGVAAALRESLARAQEAQAAADAAAEAATADASAAREDAASLRSALEAARTDAGAAVAAEMASLRAQLGAANAARAGAEAQALHVAAAAGNAAAALVAAETQRDAALARAKTAEASAAAALADCESALAARERLQRVADGLRAELSTLQSESTAVAAERWRERDAMAVRLAAADAAVAQLRASADESAARTAADVSAVKEAAQARLDATAAACDEAVAVVRALRAALAEARAAAAGAEASAAASLRAEADAVARELQRLAELEARLLRSEAAMEVRAVAAEAALARARLR